MQQMFRGSQAFNQPIDKWDVSNVTDMSYMFLESKKFKQTLPDEWKKKAKVITCYGCFFSRNILANCTLIVLGTLCLSGIAVYLLILPKCESLS